MGANGSLSGWHFIMNRAQGALRTFLIKATKDIVAKFAAVTKMVGRL